MSEPLISIVVPIYNAEDFLEKCIQSLVNQNYSNIQIILVNDGSDDNSLNICNRFKEQDSRIIVLDQKNQGVSKARSAGIEVAKGKYIGFVDSDDYIDPKMYSELLKYIQSGSAQCSVLTNYTIRPLNKRIFDFKRVLSNVEAIGELFLLRFPTSMWAYLYETKIVKNINLRGDIHFFEDFEFNYNYLKECNKIALCNGEYYFYNNNLNSINQQKLSLKKLSCLKVYDSVKKDISRFNSQELNNKAFFFRANFTISMIISLSKSVDKKNIFLPVLMKNNRLILLESLMSKYVPLSYKFVLLGFFISPSITLRLIRFRGL